MIVEALLVALGATETDIRPRPPGTTQTAEVRPLLPQDEDWSYAGSDAPAFKLQSWGPDGRIQTSLGLSVRVHGEVFHNEVFGALPGTDASTFTLITPWASAQFYDRVRVFAALKHASIAGREGPQPAAINDTLDLHQGFVELALGDGLGQARTDLLVRAGRQELHYGAGRVLSIRGGRFIRDDYDGMLVRYRKGDWVTDAFGVYGVQDGEDVFDNGTQDSLSLAGVYTSGTVRGINVDLYALELERNDFRTPAGLTDESRRYAGLRVYTTLGDHWTVDVEATLQGGEQTGFNQDIKGYQIGGRVTRAFPDLPGRPTPTLEYLMSSGDDNPLDGQVETFLAPVASGLVYEDVTQPLGPGNLAWVKGSLPLQIGSRLRVVPYLHGYWRVHSEDGLYTLFNTQLIAPGVGTSDFVGLDAGLTARLRLTDHLSAIGYASHFEAGDVFAGSGRDATGQSAMLGLTYRY